MFISLLLSRAGQVGPALSCSSSFLTFSCSCSSFREEMEKEKRKREVREAKSEKERKEEEARRKRIQNAKKAPPPVDFQSLLQLANQKKDIPIKVPVLSSVHILRTYLLVHTPNNQSLIKPSTQSIS